MLISFVTILATLVATTALVMDLRQRELQHAKGEIASLNRVLSDQTTRTFDGILLTMRSAKDRLSDNLGSRFALDSEPIQLLLKARTTGLPQVKAFFIVNSEGVAVNSSRPHFVGGMKVSQRQFYRYFADGGMDEIFISSPERSQTQHIWTYYVSMPFYDSSNQLRGVLVAVVDIQYFEKLYDSIGFDTVGQVLLLNNQGLRLAGNPHDESRYGQKEGSDASLQRLRALPEGKPLEIIEKSPEESSFVVYQRIAKYPLVIRVAVTEHQVLTPWLHVLRPIISGLLLILLLVLATSLLMVRNLRRKGLLDAALKEHDEQLRHTVQSVSDAIVTVNSAKKIILFNLAAERMFGISAGAAIGRDLGSLLDGCLSPSQLANLLSYLEDGQWPQSVPPLSGIVGLTGAGGEFPAELSLSTALFRDELLVTIVFRDLSERRRAEQELLATNRQLQELSASLHQVREAERTRIARELHDELGQQLTGIRMDVAWIGSHLAENQGPLVQKTISTKRLIDQTIASVRRISSELRPLMLDDLGFIEAARWYTNQFSERTGILVSLDLPADQLEQDSDVATALFRILQESLTNVARHAMAGQVEIYLRLTAGEWQLGIQDNGQGFDTVQGKPAGLGLIGMRERAHILGGRLMVASVPGKGTSIVVNIPDRAWLPVTEGAADR